MMLRILYLAALIFCCGGCADNNTEENKLSFALFSPYKEYNITMDFYNDAGDEKLGSLFLRNIRNSSATIKAEIHNDDVALSIHSGGTTAATVLKSQQYDHCVFTRIMQDQAPIKLSKDHKEYLFSVEYGPCGERQNIRLFVTLTTGPEEG